MPSSKQRVRALLNGQTQSPPVWGELVLDDALIAAHLGLAQVEHAQRREFMGRLGLDIVCVPLDESGSGLESIAAWARDGEYYTFALIDGSFGQGLTGMGFKPFMLEIAKKSPALEKFLRKDQERIKRLARAALDQGADAVIIGDDIAYSQGLFAPPEFFRTVYLPALRSTVQGITAQGAPVFFHCDGNLEALLPDLAACGLRGLQGLERAAGMDLMRARNITGGQLCLWGNLDPAWLSGELGQDELGQKVAAVLDAGQGGPHIFGTSSGLYTGLHPQALDWVGRALMAYANPGSQAQ